MTPARTIKVGITGGIGSGKSTVCRMFAMLGTPYYDCDSRAKELMVTDKHLVGAIKAAFGREAYAGGQPDRAYLASKVFNDKDALARLNGLVHPAVIRDFNEWAASCPAGTPYIVMESAIIFESGLEKEVDHTVTVSAPEEVRIERAAARDGAAREKVAARMANQMTDAERESRAGFVIHNDDRELVWRQVLELDSLFRKEYNEDRR